ncbi:Putative SOS response-associated peptidase YedK [Duganella sp. CF517]|uniref:SOS response-associated peptidase n=1 Tax=Duganella sp. CF517 TaxID=1881038 RepID=UPI0008D6C0AD|nr:SOS response-associated peptidase family protein [Duganella sp. CF517]SEO08245.1 Putative SOS response-associated peptidase YedK [Duganella sp. CF517]
MCGRLDQNDIGRVLNDFRWVDEVLRRGRAELLFNAAPGTLRPVLRMAGGALIVDDRWWMYKAAGAPATVRPTPNARLDKIAGRYWGRLLGAGRIIVPANGWYEWTGEKPNKQPWHIHRADGEMLYMAALTAWDARSEDRNASGFAIVTDDAEGGMIDVHDRRPVVFSASDAATWMDPELSGEQAAQLARSVSLGADKFAWHRVSTAVGNARNQGAELAAPLSPGLFD